MKNETENDINTDAYAAGAVKAGGDIDMGDLEKSFDQKLKDGRDRLTLTLDKELQFIIRNELLNSQQIFKNVGGGDLSEIEDKGIEINVVVLAPL